MASSTDSGAKTAISDEEVQALRQFLVDNQVVIDRMAPGVITRPAFRGLVRALDTIDVLRVGLAQIFVPEDRGDGRSTRCQVIHGSRPHGWTCRDDRRIAQADLDNVAAGRRRVRGETFTPEFGAEVASGARLCAGCRVDTLLDGGSL